MTDIYQSIYRKMEKIGVFGVKHYAVIEKPPFVMLCIDRLSGDTFALSQNPVEDGIMIADPDIEIKVNHSRKEAEPLTYQDRSGRRVVYPEPGRVDLRARNELATLLDDWLTDLLMKGFIRHQ